MSGKTEDRIEQIIVHVSPPPNKQPTGSTRLPKTKSDVQSLENPFISTIDQIQTIQSCDTEVTSKKRGRKPKNDDAATTQRSQSVRAGGGKQVLNNSFASDTSEAPYKSSRIDLVNINDFEIEIAKLNKENSSLKNKLDKSINDNKNKFDSLNKQITELMDKIELIGVEANKKDGVINKLIQRLEQLEKNEVEMIEKTSVEVLNDRINSLENNIELSNNNNNFPPLNWCTVATKAVKYNKTQVTKLPEQQIEIINTIASEQLDRAKRKNRVLVFGLTCPDNLNEEEKIKFDKEKIIEIFKEIKVDEKAIQHTNRFKISEKNNGRTPPIQIILKQDINRNSILAAAKKLNFTNGFKGIYINPDLTESERLLDKQLRSKRNELNIEELKNNKPFRWGVRGDKVIRFAKRDQQ